MEDNIFLKDENQLSLKQYMNYHEGGRKNLGDSVPIAVYRMLEYSIRKQLEEQFGKDVQKEVMRNAGYKAGVHFANNYLDLSLPRNQFLAELQQRMEELKIGVLRMENLDEETGRLILTVAEDADCSGLPLLGETVCNYDEGFISGILSSYMGKQYEAVEINCWATGDRVCRFQADIIER